ncbi:MAG: hypothetical protein VX910_01340, partial [Candidatus Latescibacterota bacterium]|nr:hypothetical protein [Candidatus Latescibacterota bacterium]
FPLLFRFYRFKLHSIQSPDAGPHTPLPETLTTTLHSCRTRFQSSQSSADPWAIGFMLSLKAIDVGLFVGLRSPDLEVPGDIHQPALSTSGPYRLCRHPLYFFASLFLAAQPSVSVAYAIFTTWTLAYF